MEQHILFQRERILQVETTITLLTDQLTQSNRRLDAHDSYVISHSEKMEGIKTTLKSVSQDINELQSAVVNN
jgi:Fic family protein